MAKKEERARNRTLRRERAHAARSQAMELVNNSTSADRLEAGIESIEDADNDGIRLCMFFDGTRIKTFKQDWPPACEDLEIKRGDPDYEAIEAIYKRIAESRLAEVQAKLTGEN